QCRGGRACVLHRDHGPDRRALCDDARRAIDLDRYRPNRPGPGLFHRQDVAGTFRRHAGAGQPRPAGNRGRGSGALGPARFRAAGRPAGGPGRLLRPARSMARSRGGPRYCRLVPAAWLAGGTREQDNMTDAAAGGFGDRSRLTVEDEKLFPARLARAMESRGFKVTVAESVADGLLRAEQNPPAFAVVDMRLGDGNGLDVISALKRRRADARGIGLTGYGNVARAGNAA